MNNPEERTLLKIANLFFEKKDAKTIEDEVLAALTALNPSNKEGLNLMQRNIKTIIISIAF